MNVVGEMLFTSRVMIFTMYYITVFIVLKTRVSRHYCFIWAALSPTHENIDLCETQVRSEAQWKLDCRKGDMTNSLVNIMVVMFDGGKVSAEIIVSIEHSSRVCFILAVIAAFVLTMLQSGDKDMSKMHLKYLCVCVCVCVGVGVGVGVVYVCVT